MERGQGSYGGSGGRGSNMTGGSGGRGGRSGENGAGRGRGDGAAPGRGDGAGGGGNGRGGGHGGGRGNGRGLALALAGGAGGAQNPALQTIEALMAQEARRHQPVLHPHRLDNTLWFGRDKAPRRVIAASIRRHFDGPWSNMRSVPNSAIIQWWGDFVQAFYWDQAHAAEVYRLWYGVVSLRLRDLVSKAKRSGKKPTWISSGIWTQLNEYWGTEEALRRSQQAALNRMSDRDGHGPHAHTAGSRSFDEIREHIRREEGSEPSMLRILRETHQRPDGTYVDQRARAIDEELQRQIEAMSGGSTDDGTLATVLTQEDENDMYLQYVQPQKGRVFGQGGIHTIREVGESSRAADRRNVPGSSVDTSAVLQEVADIKQQLAESTLEREELKQQLSDVLAYIKEYMPQHSMDDYAATRRTQGTGNSVTGPRHGISGGSLAAGLAAAAIASNSPEVDGEFVPDAPHNTDQDNHDDEGDNATGFAAF